MTIIDFYQSTYEPLALRNSSQNTRRLYGITLRLLDRYLQRPSKLTDLNDRTVSAFATWRQDQGVTVTTVQRDLSTLLALWRWSHKKGYVKNYPDVEIGRRPKRTPIAWRREELDQLVEAAKSETSLVGDVPGGIYWNALLLVLWDTGERIGAVTALRRNRIDLKEGWITFNAESRKGGNQDNTAKIAGDTVRAVAALIKEHRVTHPFRWPGHPSNIYKRYEKILARAGLPSGREYKFHAIRKSTASHYEAAGGNATKLLGHSSRRITKAYLDPRIVEKKSAVDLLFRPGNPK